MNTLASKVILITNKKEAQEKEKEARKEIRSKRENKKQEKNERSKRKKRNAREKKRGCAYYEMKSSGHGVAAQGTLLSICCQ